MLASSFFSIDVSRRFELGFGDLESSAVAFDRAEETGLITFVTGGADLVDLDQERVAVAIEGDVLDLLRVAARLALHPELLPRPAPEMGLAAREGLLQGRAIHPGHHEDATGLLLLDNGGNESVR